MKLTTQHKTLLFSALFLMVSYGIHSCGDTTTPPVPTNDEELITTVKLALKDSASGQYLNYYFRDLDGEGGKPPGQWDTLALGTGRTYDCTVFFLNESNPSNVIHVSAEIKAEQADHIVCYNERQTLSTFTRTDSDGVYPLGLESKWKTGTTADGDLTIILKHQPGIKDGSCNPGETDVEVKFPFRSR